MYRDSALIAYVLSAVVWALAAGYASTRLRDNWPSAFVQAGSPKPFEFWFNRQLPNSFDRFTLMSKFRAFQINDAHLLSALEVARFARWLQIILLLFLVLGPRSFDA